LNVIKTNSKNRLTNTNRIHVLEDKLDRLLSLLDKNVSTPTKEVISSSSKRVIPTDETFMKSLEHAVVIPNLVVRLSYSMKSYSVINGWSGERQMAQKDAIISVINQAGIGGAAGSNKKLWIKLDKLTQFIGMMSEAGMSVEMREQ
jgi:hypothetical protein|tara:strand:- start:610 stop:1047 length:438 start_codon:yes stop_codon:yes gene_type:complete